jgi:hypothetical protein
MAVWLDTATRQLLDDFWRSSGEREPFPRNLERPLALALPVAVVKLPRLRLAEVEAWLHRRSVDFQFGCENRSIRGCLVAHRGQGMVFLDGTDLAPEQRYTLAHEIAHFLVDYSAPRSLAIARLGPAITDVLDGLRPITLEERIAGLLTGIRVGPYQSLMERDPALLTGKVLHVEDRADRLALALLAPPEDVLRVCDVSASQYHIRRASTETVLQAVFGLPGGIAQAYAARLLAVIGKGPTWVESLRPE